MGKNCEIIGWGSLNWDIFFEVEDLSSLNWEGIIFEPGKEVVAEREALKDFLIYLQKEGKKVYECGGGSAANTIYALGKMGYAVSFIGICGEDEYGEKIINSLKKAGITRNFISKAGKTNVAIIVLDKHKDRFIAVFPGNCEKKIDTSTLNQIQKEFYNYLFSQKLLKKRVILHMSSYATKEGISFQKAFIKRFSEHLESSENLCFSLDPGEIYAKKGKAFLKNFLNHLHFLFITQKELELTRLSLEDLKEFKNLKGIFLKMGKKGGMGINLKKNLYVRECAFWVSEIVDNTGAGDYFNAGVLAILGKANKINLKEIEIALEKGLLLASKSLKDYGRAWIQNLKEGL